MGGGGLRGGNVAMELTYNFRGWQRREGTNCARLDFTGTIKPNTASTTNNPSFVGRIINSVVPPNEEEGDITGQSWFDPGLQLAVETRYQQSITAKSSTVRRVRTKRGTNEPVLVDASAPTNEPAPNPPAQTITTSTTSSEQYTTIKLFDVELLEK